MSNARYYIEIKNTKIPVIVRNYSNKNSIKIFFSGDILNISKPKWYSTQKLINKYGNDILNEYNKIISPQSDYIMHWVNDEKLLYKGKAFTVIRKEENSNKVFVNIDEGKSIIDIKIPKKLDDENVIKESIVRCIKNIFKNNTYVIIQEKLDYWTKEMNLEYTNFKINDTKSKYGSCIPKQKKLFFSLRLIMLPDEIIDSIVVHELAHIVYPNHSKDFYDLVKKYIPNYDKSDKWLKDNSYLLKL